MTLFSSVFKGDFDKVPGSLELGSFSSTQGPRAHTINLGKSQNVNSSLFHAAEFW